MRCLTRVHPVSAAGEEKRPEHFDPEWVWVGLGFRCGAFSGSIPQSRDVKFRLKNAVMRNPGPGRLPLG